MKVLLEAPILTQSGYGEHARLVFKSLLLQDGVQIYTNPLNWGNTSWSSSLDPKLKDKIQQSIDNLSLEEVTELLDKMRKNVIIDQTPTELDIEDNEPKTVQSDDQSEQGDQQIS